MNAPFFWHRPSLMGYVLAPLSLLYWWVACLRTASLEETALPLPVICVGNNTVGGSGKTPTVVAIASLLQARGKTPHVISRGYKGHYSGTLQVDPQQHRAEEVGDEPLLIARHAPCWVARKRTDAALAAIAAGADCLIMDDGMQNPTLKKRFTLMVIDGAYGFGNRQMLPAGPCREPISLSLAKADALLIMGEQSHADVRSLSATHERVAHAKLVPCHPEMLQGKSWLAFAGIGRPQKFFDTLQAQGATLTDSAAFPDHHAYTPQELERLAKAASEQNAALITTEKDWLRLPKAWQERVAFLEVKASIEQSEQLESWLLDAMKEAA